MPPRASLHALTWPHAASSSPPPPPPAPQPPGPTSHLFSTLHVPGWKVADSFVKVTHYGAPLQQILSTTQWIPVGTVDVQFPVRYHQVLCCDRSPIASLWPCDPTAAGLPFQCDPFVSIRRWSPRRNHVALTVQYKPPGGILDTYIVVLGGRGRFPKETIPPSYLVVRVSVCPPARL
jgi:hypothetical protein